MPEKKYDLETIEKAFNKRYRIKKTCNIVISLLIIILGTLSVLFIWNHDQDGLLTFRWLTVDGTLFTVIVSAIYVTVNLVEMIRLTELTALSTYFIRLSGAVAEGLIMIVVLMSQLPVFSEHMIIFRIDMFNMHLLIPILTISSFVLNDPSIGRLNPLQIFMGTSFVSVYAIIITILIQTGLLRNSKIPYFFLDFDNMSLWLIFITFLIIYGIGYLLSWWISSLNRKLSWRWFKRITDKN
ncbi:MAG: hypothetical protein K6G03_06635 [Lachnospiraceae bacterium]|nr:hypothetical protein [Lachnospiraceae bacterium]